MHLEHQGRKDELKASDTKEARELSDGDIEGRTSHETSYDGYRYQLHYPAEAEQSDAQDDEAANERQIYGDFGTGIFFGVFMVDVCNDLRDRKRHDCDWADGNILRCGEQLKEWFVYETRIGLEPRPTQYVMVPTKAE